MSSVVRVMHTHLVTFEHVFPEDHRTQAAQYRKRAEMHLRAPHEGEAA
jgi:hypothetical protein